VQVSLLLQNDKYLSAIKDKQKTLQDLLQATELKENDTLKATQKQLELNDLQKNLLDILGRANDAGSQKAAKLLEVSSYNDFASVAELYHRDYQDLATDQGGSCAGGIARPEDIQLANYYYSEMLKYRQLKSEAEQQVTQFTELRTLAESQAAALQQQQTLAAQELALLQESIGNNQDQINAKQEELAIAQFRVDALLQLRNWTEQTQVQLLSVEQLNLAQAQLEQEIAANRQDLIDDAVKAQLNRLVLNIERDRQIAVVKLEQLNQLKTEEALQTAINNLRSDLGVNPIAEIIQLADYKGQLAGILTDIEALKEKQSSLPEATKTLLDNTIHDIHTALQAKETLTIEDNLLKSANALIEQSNTLKADVAKLQQEEQRYLDLLTQSETDLQGATKALYDEIQKSGVLDSEKTLLNAQNLEIFYKIGYAEGAVDLSSDLAKQSKEILEQVIAGRIEERKVREKATVNNILGTVTSILNVVGTILSFTPLAPIGATLKVVASATSAVQAAYNGDWAGAIFNTAMAVVSYQINKINPVLNDAEKTLTTAKNAQGISEAVKTAQIAEATQKLETLRTTLGPNLKSLQTLEATIEGTYKTYIVINSGDNTLALLSAVQGLANVINVKGLKVGETLDQSTNFSNFEKALITAGQVSVSSYQAINAIETGNLATVFKSLSNIAGTIAGNFATELKQQEHKNLNLVIIAAKESENIYTVAKAIEEGKKGDALKGIASLVKDFRNILKEKNQDPPTVTNNTGNSGETSSVSVPQELSLWNKIEQFSEKIQGYADKIEQKIKKEIGADKLEQYLKTEIGLDFNKIENIAPNVLKLYNILQEDTDINGWLSDVQKILKTWDKEIDKGQLTSLNQVLNTANILTDASTLTGVNGDDLLSVGEGKDSVNVSFTVAMNQTISDQVLNGTADTDSVTGNNSTLNLTQAGVQVAFGSAGNDELYATETQNVFLSGAEGDDTLTGGSGNDLLLGNEGNDQLYLGAEDGVVDIVKYAFGDGADTLYQFVRGVGGDQIEFTGITNIDVVTSGSNTLLRLGDGTTGNADFGTGELLVTLSGTSGFSGADMNINLFGTNFLFS
jgi:hypothetical protein